MHEGRVRPQREMMEGEMMEKRVYPLPSPFGGKSLPFLDRKQTEPNS
jgi:hypothetical protein